MMKKIYVGALLASMLAQPVFGMEEERKNDSMHTVVRSPEEQKKLNEELFDAVKKDDFSRVQELIKQGASVNAWNNNIWFSTKRNALHWACTSNKVALVKLLLLHANVNARDSQGWMCLHFACHFNYLELIKVLLDHKDIQVDVADVRWHTPLDLACMKDRVEAVKLLLKSQVKSGASWQQTRLMWIGFMKEEEADCNLAKLSAEMIHSIISFCGNKRKNIERVKSFICRKNNYCTIARIHEPDNIKKELGHILDPQAWQDDKTAEKTYDALVKLLQEDEKKQSNQNGKEEQE